ncbi:FHA domain-containing protein [Micrococcaceae bacterium Sec5.7]
MVASNYISGSWLGIVRSRTAVVLRADTTPALVQSLWELLETGPEVHEVLHAVTRSFGVSLAKVPPFGIVDFQDSLGVFLRGDIDLTVQLPTGPVELNGRDVTTWTERWLLAPEWYSLTVPGEATGSVELPLSEGVVLLQGLRVAVAGAGNGARGRPSPASAEAGATPEAAAAVFAAPSPAPAPAIAPGPATMAASAALPSQPPPAVVPPSKITGTEDPQEAEDPPESASAGTAGSGDGSAPEPSAEEVPAEVSTAAGSDGTVTDEPATDEPVAESTEHGASAETVMGVSDDDAHPDLGRPARAAVPANEHTGTYDHLWEKTVVRSIEDAAVRDEPENGGGHGSAGQQPVAGEAGEAGSAGSDSDGPDPGRASEDAGASLPQTPPLPVQEAAARPPASVELIDSVPWHSGGDNPPRPGTPSSFNATPATPAPPVAGLPMPRRQNQPGRPVDNDGDHDGQTIMKSDLAGTAAHQARLPAPDSEAACPLVLARVCAQGHANPSTNSRCFSCRMPLPADAVQVPRPRLGRVRLSTGEVVDLDQSLVIGRQPSVSRVQGGVMPRLVQVASPSGDISRSHVEVRLEGWHVMLCDLKATNGTVLVREGQQPRRLAQNEMAILLDGDIAELGDDISLRFEEIL